MNATATIIRGHVKRHVTAPTCVRSQAVIRNHKTISAAVFYDDANDSDRNLSWSVQSEEKQQARKKHCITVYLEKQIST